MDLICLMLCLCSHACVCVCVFAHMSAYVCVLYACVCFKSVSVHESELDTYPVLYVRMFVCI